MPDIKVDEKSYSVKLGDIDLVNSSNSLFLKKTIQQAIEKHKNLIRKGYRLILGREKIVAVNGTILAYTGKISKKIAGIDLKSFIIINPEKNIVANFYLQADLSSPKGIFGISYARLPKGIKLKYGGGFWEVNFGKMFKNAAHGFGTILGLLLVLATDELLRYKLIKIIMNDNKLSKIIERKVLKESKTLIEPFEVLHENVVRDVLNKHHRFFNPNPNEMKTRSRVFGLNAIDNPNKINPRLIKKQMEEKDANLNGFLFSDTASDDIIMSNSLFEAQVSEIQNIIKPKFLSQLQQEHEDRNDKKISNILNEADNLENRDYKKDIETIKQKIEEAKKNGGKEVGILQKISSFASSLNEITKTILMLPETILFIIILILSIRLFIKTRYSYFEATIKESRKMQRIFEMEKNVDIKEYAELVAAINNLVKSESVTGLLVYGQPGTGKSFMVRKTLHELGVKYSVHKGASKSLEAFVKLLFDHRNDDVIVLDDFDSALKDQDFIAFIKAATDTYPERVISIPQYDVYQFKAIELKPVPDKFLLRAKIIIITNKKKEEIPPAVLSRTLGVNMNFTNKEMVRIITKLIDFFNENVPKEHKLEVLDYLAKLAKKYPIRIDFRLFKIALDMSLVYKNNWKEVLENLIKKPAAL